MYWINGNNRRVSWEEGDAAQSLSFAGKGDGYEAYWILKSLPCEERLLMWREGKELSAISAKKLFWKIVGKRPSIGLCLITVYTSSLLNNLPLELSGIASSSFPSLRDGGR